MKKKVLIVTTGGTIVSPKGIDGAAPDARRTDDLLGLVTDYFETRGRQCTVSRIFGESGVDSSDIGPAEWVRLAGEIVVHAADGLGGVLVIHGTDTMAYTAAWLSLCFDGAGFPVILTGSQRTPDCVPFDGTTNVLAAAEAIEKQTPGVWICFDWKLHRGSRAHKKSAAHIDAFSSLGMEPLELDALRADTPVSNVLDPLPAEILKTVSARGEEEARACAAKVRTHFVSPGQAFCGGDETILILCGYGAGNMPQSIHRQVEKSCGAQKPLLIACSQAELGVKDPLAYRNVGIGGLAAQGFAVWSQGDYPLEFITALANLALLSGEPRQVLSKYLKKIS